MDPVLIATAAGLSLGITVGYRAGKAVVLKVAGPFARKPLAIILSVGGALGFLVPATIFAFFGTRNFVAQSGGGMTLDSAGALIGVVAAIGIVIASGLVVAAFAGGLCARFAEEFRALKK
jgi:hypothetical protein